MHLFLERFWLFFAIVLTVVTCIYSFQDGFYHTRLFWLIAGIAWAMFFMRKGVRKRIEKFEEQNNTNKK